MVGAFSYGREQVATVSGPSANGVHAETSYGAPHTRDYMRGVRKNGYP